MATERLPMRTIREILRQKWQLGRSNRAVAKQHRFPCAAPGERRDPLEVALDPETTERAIALLARAVLAVVRAVAEAPDER